MQSNPDYIQNKGRLPGIANVLPFIVVLFNTEIMVRKSQLTIAQASTAFMADPTQLIILGISYLFALACLVHRFQRSLGILGRHKIFIVMLFYILASALWSQFPLKVFIAWGHFIGFTLVAIAACYYFESRPGSLSNSLVWYGLVLLSISIPLSIFFPKIGTDLLSGRWQGIMGNPNHLGIVCFVSVWASLTSLKLTRKKIKSILLLVLSAIALFGSHSATSTIISILICAFLILFVVLKQKRTLNDFFMKTGTLIVVLLMSLISLYVIDPSLVGPEGFNKIVGRDITLTGRWDLWKTGFALFLDKPILGWSYDVLLSVFAKQNITQGQFHNGYLDLVIRGGLIGLVLFFAVLVKLIRVIKRLIAVDYERTLMYLALLLGIMIHNITEASFVRAPNILWLLFLVLYFSTGESASTKKTYHVQQ